MTGNVYVTRTTLPSSFPGVHLGDEDTTRTASASRPGETLLRTSTSVTLPSHSRAKQLAIFSRNRFYLVVNSRNSAYLVENTDYDLTYHILPLRTLLLSFPQECSQPFVPAVPKSWF